MTDDELQAARALVDAADGQRSRGRAARSGPNSENERRIAAYIDRLLAAVKP